MAFIDSELLSICNWHANNLLFTIFIKPIHLVRNMIHFFNNTTLLRVNYFNKKLILKEQTRINQFRQVDIVLSFDIFPKILPTLI